MIRSAKCLHRFYSKNMKILSRNIKTKVEEPTKVKYTDTINLPKTKFPARLNQSQREEVEKLVRATHLSPLYDWQRKNLPASNEYVLHDGPPYANGDLHMGHAVNKILKDIILKQKIIDKRRVHYVPGWDCHGLPIELKAVGNAKSSQSPLEIREKAKKFALDSIKKQKESFERWGVTGSWNDQHQTYRTFDKEYIKNQLRMFYKMYERGLIYRDMKPIFFSPSSSSALAEAELEYDDNFESPSLYFRCELMNTGENFKVYALIWTTTPWTLPANQGICINKALKYSLVKINNDHYVVCDATIENLQKELETEIERVKEVNSDQLLTYNYRHPIDQSEILNIFEGQHVQADKGTGIVHTAPSHGHDDFLVFLNKKIPLKRLVNDQGCFNKNAPAFLHDKEVLGEGNDAVLEYVKSTDNIVKLKTLKHSYPIDWRTKKPVIILASEQWFINTEKIKSRAIQELESVKIFPEKSAKNSKNVLQVQLEKRPYWCISRQRSWGIPIPVLYDDSKKPILNENLINHYVSLVEESGSIDFWWKNDVRDLLPKESNFNNLTKGLDILDIWFDSGISWSYALDGDQVADLYLEGVDQFTGWFQSSLMTSVGIRDKAPYKNIFVHGFAVDEHGKKMSKSIGNIVSPESIVKKYGTDVMRWWIAAHATQHSLIPVSNKLLEDGANNLVKIRATLKYLLGVIEKSDVKFDENKLKHLDKFILHQMTNFTNNSRNFYENFQFNRIVAVANNFVNTDLSSCYLHLVKDRLYCGTMSEHQQLAAILSLCYHSLCKSLWPVIPFLVEESWNYLGTSKAFYQSEINKETFKFEESVKTVNYSLDLKSKLCSMITTGNTLKHHVTIEGDCENLKDLLEIHPSLDIKINDSELCEILQVSSITLKDQNSSDLKISFELTDEELCPRCRRFTMNGSGICVRCESVLSSKN